MSTDAKIKNSAPRAKRLQSLICLLLFTLTLIICKAEAEASIYSRGSSGSTVQKIQTRLKNWGYYNGEIDGIYGIKTAEAIQWFQQNNNLLPDGIAGQNTLDAMGLPYTPAPVFMDDDDLLLIARVIHGEGRGEDYLGQIAIGAVIMNRLKHPSFPDTIKDIIFQPGAFDAVRDGQINLTPSESCINAAKEALNGHDPVNGALFYWNPKTATCSWITNLTIVKDIGNHSFAVN